MTKNQPLEYENYIFHKFIYKLILRLLLNLIVEARNSFLDTFLLLHSSIIDDSHSMFLASWLTSRRNLKAWEECFDAKKKKENFAAY